VASERPSVILALGNGGHGGMQAQVRLVAESLAARGHDTAIAVGGGGLEHVDGVDVIALPTFSTRWPVPYLRALRTLSARRGAHVVHGHGLRLAPVVARSRVARRLVTCHGIDPARAARTISIVRRSDVQFVACGEGPRVLLARHGVTSVVVNNAFSPPGPGPSRSELNESLGLRPDVPLVVLPARYSEQKGHATLLEALRIARSGLGEGVPEVVCAGDGPLLGPLRDRAASGGSPPLARCLPYRPDARTWLAASDFFVLPSRWEGQPLVVLEALNHGLAVASTSVTGLEDLVVDGRNGRLVTYPPELAAVIVEWCREPARRPRDAALTSEILARHQLERVVDSLVALYVAEG
jgi:glycosyltransferase involved in cell wall biosynthesis